MSLAESQQFFYDLCARPDTIRRLRKNRAQILKKYFRQEADREAIARYPLERFQTYRDHVSEGLLGEIERAFPVLRSLIRKSTWNELLNDFYLQRLTRSPLARQVFQEFSAFLQTYRGPLLKQIPYFHELAEYEALDLQLFFAPDKRPQVEWASAAPMDPLTLIPILNPQVELRIYRWPVHLMKKGDRRYRRKRPGQYPIIVYRHPESMKIRFMEGNRLFADLIKAVRPGRKSIRRIMGNLATQHNIATEQRKGFVIEGVTTLAYLRQKGIILGMKSPHRRTA